jgi:hypothetical protein
VRELLAALPTQERRTNRKELYRAVDMEYYGTCMRGVMCSECMVCCGYVHHFSHAFVCEQA